MIKRPYHLLLITAILLFILSFWHRKDSIDIHLYDTYFVFSGVYYMMSFFFLLCWGIYRLTEKFLLTKYLTWFHVIITILFFTCIFTTSLSLKTSSNSFMDMENFYRQQQQYIWIGIVLIIAQAAFVVNLVGGAIRRIYK